MSFGENTNPHPFEIEDAREAQRAASEAQRENADALAQAHAALADAEYTYRSALTARLNQLKDAGVAATVCGEVARGEESIGHLRRERDKRAGEVEKLRQDSFRLAADRRGLDGLIRWSMGRDLRIDSQPSQRQWDERTGELRPRAVA